MILHLIVTDSHVRKALCRPAVKFRLHQHIQGREAVSEALLIKATEANRINTKEQQQGRRPNIELVKEGVALTTDLLRHNAQAFLRLCQACQG
ncbi:TPA: hypothetical protein ACH3X1_015288 [Trebouxia sp. C0004]